MQTVPLFLLGFLIATVSGSFNGGRFPWVTKFYSPNGYIGQPTGNGFLVSSSSANYGFWGIVPVSSNPATTKYLITANGRYITNIDSYPYSYSTSTDNPAANMWTVYNYPGTSSYTFTCTALPGKPYLGAVIDPNTGQYYLTSQAASYYWILDEIPIEGSELAQNWDYPAPIPILTAFTVSAFIYVTPGSSGIGRIFDQIQVNTPNGWLVDLYPTNSFRVIMTSGVVPPQAGTITIPQGQWTHVSVSFVASGTVYIWVNGQLRAGVSVPMQTSNTLPVRIGRDNQGGNIFPGKIFRPIIYVGFNFQTIHAELEYQTSKYLLDLAFPTNPSTYLVNNWAQSGGPGVRLLDGNPATPALSADFPHSLLWILGGGFGSNYQKWRMYNVDSNYYVLINVRNGMVLDGNTDVTIPQVNAATPQPFLGPVRLPLSLYSAGFGANHQWQFVPVSSNPVKYKIINRINGGCLDANANNVPQYDPAAPSPFMWTSCDSTDNHLWYYNP